MPVAINCAMFTFRPGVNGLVLAQFELNQNNHQGLINTNVPIASIDNFTSRLNDIVNVAENSDISKSLCDVLEMALDMTRITNNNNVESYENMAIMITDFTLNLGANFTTMSDEFNRRGITLVVVAIITPDYEIWDRYRTLARNTGGGYMLLQNAPAILERIILSTINEEDTLRQAFYH